MVAAVAVPPEQPRPPSPRWDLYEGLLLRAMGVPPLAELAAGSARAFRGLFMPSFHRDLCITVLARADGGEVRIAILHPRARATALEAIGVNLGGPVEPDLARIPPARRFHAALDRGRTERFTRSIDALDREALAAPRGLGCDGIQLAGAIASVGEVFELSAWSPRAGSDQHAFFATLHRLAVEFFEHEEVRLAMEHLHGYLDLGPPLVDLGGKPRRVRLFGMLGYPPPAELTALFESLASDEPLVMDMSNFENMGTLLYPLFRKLARRPGPTTWCVSASARRQLAAAGVDAAVMFARIDDASAECARRSSAELNRPPGRP
jgi:hypothetical protein